MKISIGSDHRGFELKSKIIENFKKIEWLDVGTDLGANQRVNYPMFAQKVCKNILEKKSEQGILICGSGIGIAIAANRFKKIYAGLCWDKEVAKAAKEHDNINVLVLPADFVNNNQAIEIINAWLSSEFKFGIYKERLDSIDSIDL
ncbi:RpiB/LacA/LacB family sugar-phosphate isomerase [Candidatus Babeliales bacterium]|nr:RpiB/LacA/LacB family sugar-phosphate isomerase [Candidatus Babeliales bacterium]